ncbi:MAG: YggS family pyridoxal phosphate-dependent enzyme [Anaerolineaceae bacterium]|nr:YggS family pyridoxal phosphate-dependent enzyme [Anaerolineaceae bacterium]MCB9101376.1 YggS family pyridoxal phosphate-dependent enzyme [Anaerolineales bacterium]
MAEAAERAGRNVADVTLVAVSKTHPLDVIIDAYQAGLHHFGENRSDEFQDKRTGFSKWLAVQAQAEPVYWHFIGHVQSRQAGLILDSQPALIHSVDSLKLAQRLDRLARSQDAPPVNVLLQCNVSGESSKSGFALHQWATDQRQLANFLNIIEQIAALEKITIAGLMTMAPYSDAAEDSRPVFRRLAALRSKLRETASHLAWPHLSMGMTNDFEVGIEEGATIIRVGRAIFGERNYN